MCETALVTIDTKVMSSEDSTSASCSHLDFQHTALKKPTELKPHHPPMFRSHAPFEPSLLFVKAALWELMEHPLGSWYLGLALGWLPAPLGSRQGCEDLLLFCCQQRRALLPVQSFYHLGVAGNIARAPSLSSESSVAITLLGMHFSHLFHGSLSDFPHTLDVT